MMKTFVLAAFSGISFLCMSLLVEAYSTVATPLPDPVSTPVALLLLGTGLSALAFWGKRPHSEK